MGVNGANTYTLPFEAAREADFPRIGGKCASLARMIAGGQRVPGGFAVTTDAYALHLQSDGLRADVERYLSRIEVDNVDDEETVSREIRDAIVAHPCR